MQFHKTILPNGLRVLTIPMPSFESATVLVMVRAGSRFETKDTSGISHFLEHMPFKGTKKRPSPLLIAHTLDNIGAEWNAFTAKETTAYYIKTSATHVELSFDLLSDLLDDSLFDPVEINKERGVIIEELNMYEDTPMRKIGDIYDSLLYGDSPMGWDIGGTKSVIQKLQREDFLTYMDSLYSSHNMTVVAAGGVHVERITALAEKYFGNMKRFDINGYDKVIENQTKQAVLIKKKKTEQVHMALGVRTVPLEHKDRYALDLLAIILGGGTSSRLFHEIREKRGLAYYVRTSSDNYSDCGTLVSTAGIDPKRIHEAVQVMIEEYRSIKKPGPKEIKPEELKKAKEYVKGHFVLDLEDSRSVASFYAHQELLERHVDNPQEALDKIDAVTMEDVLRVANNYLVTKHLNLAIIGNFANGQHFKKLLEL